MSAEELERKRQLEALWVRHLDGDTGAADELAAAIRPGGPVADALAADEGLHRMLGGLGRAGADTDAFVARVESVVAAEASGERFVRAVEARIQVPARRRRRWLPWSLVFAPVLAGALVVAVWPRAPRQAPGDQRPAPTSTAAAPGAGRVTVVLGSLATPAPAGKRLVPGQTVPAGLTLASDQGRACLRLGDGSRLCLERASRLRLDDGGGTEPRLWLEAGKVAATIAPRSAGTPLSIHTPAGETTALGTAFSVELAGDGASSITRVVAGAVAVRARGVAEAVTVQAHRALSLASRSPWRMSAEEEREEWSLLRGQIASALLAASTTEAGPPADRRPSGAAAGGGLTTTPDALLALADALRSRGRLRDAQGICDGLARAYPDRRDIARLAAELRAPPPPAPWNATPAVYRINAGGSRYVDPRGNVWSADSHHRGGTAGEFWEDIDGTDMDPLYRSERFAFADDRLAYSLPLADGQYVVRLHFAEIWAGTLKPGMRKFDVLVEGQPALSGYDIAADAGPMTATVKQVIATVSDGSLDIDFRHVVENPKISGIEVFALPAGAVPPPAPAPATVYPPLPLPPTDAVYRVNVGGREYVDPQGRRWQADDHFSDAGLGEALNVDIAGTDLDPLYQTMRYACQQRRLSYRFPVPAGRYRIRLHFAEIEPDAFAGKWLMDVQVEGAKLLANLDVYAEAGLRRALIKEAVATVDDGGLELSLQAVRVCAQVAGIEVIPLPPL